MAKRSGIMLASPINTRKLAGWKPPYLVQPKLDGVRCRAVIANGRITLLSSQLNTFNHIFHLNRELTELINKGILPMNAELDGELYRHGMNFKTIAGIVKRSVNIHPNFEQMEYHIFDLVEPLKQKYRIARMKSLTEYVSGRIKIVPTFSINSLSEIDTYLGSFMQDGYEGIIIRQAEAFYARKRVMTMMKLKPRKRDTYRIIASKEEISIDGIPKDTLGAFICIKDGQIFSVGTGPLLTKNQRQEFWDRRSDWDSGKFWLDIKYQNLTPDRKVPYHSVAVGILEDEKDN